MVLPRPKMRDAAARGDQQPAPRQIGDGDVDDIDRAAMLEPVQFLEKLGFQPATEHAVDAQHHDSFP